MNPVLILEAILATMDLVDRIAEHRLGDYDVEAYIEIRNKVRRELVKQATALSVPIPDEAEEDNALKELIDRAIPIPNAGGTMATPNGSVLLPPPSTKMNSGVDKDAIALHESVPEGYPVR